MPGVLTATRLIHRLRLSSGDDLPASSFGALGRKDLSSDSRLTLPWESSEILQGRFCRTAGVLRSVHPVCTALTIPYSAKVSSSGMSNKNSRKDKEAEAATLRAIKQQMAKPRIAKSARTATSEDAAAGFSLSGSVGAGLASPSRRRARLVTHPGSL
jgi:hypothetical protein